MLSPRKSKETKIIVIQYLNHLSRKTNSREGHRGSQCPWPDETSCARQELRWWYMPNPSVSCKCYLKAKAAVRPRNKNQFKDSSLNSSTLACVKSSCPFFQKVKSIAMHTLAMINYPAIPASWALFCYIFFFILFIIDLHRHLAGDLWSSSVGLRDPGGWEGLTSSCNIPSH